MFQQMDRFGFGFNNAGDTKLYAGLLSNIIPRYLKDSATGIVVLYSVLFTRAVKK